MLFYFCKGPAGPCKSNIFYLLLILGTAFPLTCSPATFQDSLVLFQTKQRESHHYVYFSLHISDIGSESNARSFAGLGRVNSEIRMYIFVLGGERQVGILAKEPCF